MIKQIYESILSSSDELTAEELISLIRSKVEEFKLPDATFIIEYEGDLYIEGSREETMDEQIARVNAENERKLTYRQREWKTYQELKAKFETPPVQLP